jgi:competence protein ComEA
MCILRILHYDISIAWEVLQLYFIRKNWIFLLLPIVLIILLLYIFSPQSDQQQEYLEWEQSLTTAVEEPDHAPEREVVTQTITVFVDIKGEVLIPGVYEVNESSRIQDLIKLAGGYTANADRNGINLAQKVKDEMVIYVPAKGENQPEWTNKVTDANESKLININEAEQTELETLPGIGPAKAAAIIAYREENGLFKTIDDLGNVSGIGDKSLEKLREYITVK